MTRALVTGASSGIGRELARILAARGHDLVLAARRGERLSALARGLEADHGVRVAVRVADLARPGATSALVEGIGEPPEILVNNAGFGLRGRFAELDKARQLAMIRVNVNALTELTHLLLPPMLERGRGRILNVASTAAFQPGPFMAVYYATKAFVLSFSEALASEVAGTGVTVTALCPGPTRTEFGALAGFPDSRFIDRVSMTAGEVARAGVLGMMRGRVVVVPGAGNRVGALLVRLLPRSLVRAAIRRFQEDAG